MPATMHYTKPKHPLIKDRELKEALFNSLEAYFEESASNIYSSVLADTEVALFEVILRKAKNKKTRAARILGLDITTFRTKLQRYDMLNKP